MKNSKLLKETWYNNGCKTGTLNDKWPMTNTPNVQDPYCYEVVHSAILVACVDHLLDYFPLPTFSRHLGEDIIVLNNIFKN